MTDQVTPEWRNKMHISLMIGDQELMGSDSPPEYCEEPKAFPCRCLNDPVEAEHLSHIENGKIRMPFNKRFGLIVSGC